MKIAKFGNFLINSSIVVPSELMGCSEVEVGLVSASQGFHVLPSVYKMFLMEMGKSAGQYWGGLCGFYPEIIDLNIREGLNSQLLEYGVGPLSKDAFVFRSDQGVQYYYFICDNEDPLVRCVWPFDRSLPQRHGIELIVTELKFSDFLYECANHHIKPRMFPNQ